MSLRIDKLAPALGARVTGIDLSLAPDDRTVRVLAAALAEHGVLVFPEQAIDDASHVRFARCFGEPGVFRPVGDPQGLEPEIFRLANTDPAGNLLPEDNERLRLQRLNWTWHIDGSYRAFPNKGTILHGIQVVTEGGDTVFANLAAAYAALPEATQARIAGLAARHDFEFQVRERGLPAMRAEERARLPPVEHPLVRQHPDGRRSLYLSPPYMQAIVGWEPRASRALIDELLEWAAQGRFLYRHRWRRHDLLMWDNGWTMHRVTPFDIARRVRLMHGVTLLGSEPVLPSL